MFRKLILCTVMAAMLVEASHADERHLVTGKVSAEQYTAMLFGALPPKVRTRGIHMHGEEAPAAAQAQAPAAPQVASVPAAAQPVQAEPKPEARVVVQPVNFANNSSEIPAGLKENLVSLAAAMQKPEAKGKLLLVTGHTDSKGSADYNLVLSMRRAEAVEQFLIGHGVSGSQVVSAGKGMTQPLPGTSDMDPQNRRVEFRVTAN